MIIFSYNGGYYPYQISFEESQKLMISNPQKFKLLVQESLRKHVEYINILVNKKGMKFWDYGNCFLLEASRAKANILASNSRINDLKFLYPSYVQDIMGDIFSLGFGPFRWVCTSGLEDDLIKSDKIAEKILTQLYNNENNSKVKGQYGNIFYKLVTFLNPRLF